MSRARDRLAELQKLNPNNEVEIQIDSSKENKTFKKIYEKVEGIRLSIDGIRGNTKRIRDLLEAFQVLPTKDLQSELHSVLAASTTITYIASNKLKEFEGEIKKLKDGDVAAESRIKKLQLASLKQEFQNALYENSDVIENYRNIFKTQLKASAKIVQRVANEEELENLIDDKKPIQVFIDNILVDTEVSRQALRDIEVRHKELLFIEDKVREVNELFKQIAILIEDQQELVNRVEHHTQSSTDYVEHGTIDLAKSHKKKNKCFKMKMYLIAALIFVILCITISFFI